LLIEESRTNLIEYSDTQSFIATRSSRGLQQSFGGIDGFIYNTVNQDNPNVSITKAISSVGNYTFSFFIKKTEHNTVDIRFASGGNAGRGVGAKFTFSSETWSNQFIDGTYADGIMLSHQYLGNDIWRLSVSTSFLSGVTDLFPVVYFAFDLNGTYVSQWIGGAQIEEGAFPTSYIKTSGASATRSADNASITGENFSSWYRQDEGSVYTEYNPFAPSSITLTAHFDDGTNNMRHYLRPAGNNVQPIIVSNSSNSFDAGTIPQNLYQFNKAAYVYKKDDFSFSVNGSDVKSDSSGSVPVGLTSVNFGQTANGGSYRNFYLKKLSYYPQRLTNEQLQQLTK